MERTLSPRDVALIHCVTPKHYIRETSRALLHAIVQLRLFPAAAVGSKVSMETHRSR